MLSKFIKILKSQEYLLSELLSLAEQQTNNLKNNDISLVEDNSRRQNDILNQITVNEELRIDFLSKWLNIEKKDALRLKVSSIERRLKGEALLQVKEIRESILRIQVRLDKTSKQNRILSNRAKFSVNNILKIFSSDKTAVFNVRV